MSNLYQGSMFASSALPCLARLEVASLASSTHSCRPLLTASRNGQQLGARRYTQVTLER